MVVITRNVDLSVESVIGLVAFVVADILESAACSTARSRSLSGSALGLVLGHGQRVHRRGAAGPVDRRDAGHAEHLPRASTSSSPAGKQVTLTDLPAGYTEPGPRDGRRHPGLRASSPSRSSSSSRGPAPRDPRSAGRSTPSAATRRRPRSWASARAASCSPCSRCAASWRASPASCGGSSSGRSTRRRRRGSPSRSIAAVVVGGVNIFGGIGTVVGAALGALFLGFVANALILFGLSQFWLQAIYGVVILVAVGARRRSCCAGSSARTLPDGDRDDRAGPPRRDRRRSSAGRRCCSSSSSC